MRVCIALFIITALLDTCIYGGVRDNGAEGLKGTTYGGS
jgi:hypothetical protein